MTGTPCIALQLSIYGYLKNKFPSSYTASKSRRIFDGMIFGSASGLISQTVTYWGDTIKRRMQSDGIGGKQKIYDSSIDCARKIFEREGVKGFYRGYLANALRSIPGAAIQLTAYDQVKNLLRVRD